MNQYRQGNVWTTTPPIVKNLLIINLIVFAAQMLLPHGLGRTLTDNFSLHFWKGDDFRLYQLFTYMFLHGNFTHLLTNMFALWMFGRILEYDLGSRRFLIFYLVSGLGAGLMQLGVNWIEYASVMRDGMITNQQAYYQIIYGSTLGASGAIFGILLAYGLLHPNNTIMLLIPPIPMKAKWFVIGYGLLELFAGVSGTGGNVAHFAHLGGMLWGFLLLWWWKRKGEIYY